MQMCWLTVPIMSIGFTSVENFQRTLAGGPLHATHTMPFSSSSEGYFMTCSTVFGNSGTGLCHGFVKAGKGPCLMEWFGMRGIVYRIRVLGQNRNGHLLYWSRETLKHLGYNLFFKRFQSIKYFFRFHLTSDDYAQIFWSIKLLVVITNLSKHIKRLLFKFWLLLVRLSSHSVMFGSSSCCLCVGCRNCDRFAWWESRKGIILPKQRWPKWLLKMNKPKIKQDATLRPNGALIWCR